MRSLNLAKRFVISAAAASLIPGAAWACPACTVGDPKTAATYFGMTVVMSALPILLVCGLGYWLWRRYS
jgi:membrane protein DedA with SNARE-associated domain